MTQDDLDVDVDHYFVILDFSPRGRLDPRITPDFDRIDASLKVLNMSVQHQSTFQAEINHSHSLNFIHPSDLSPLSLDSQVSNFEGVRTSGRNRSILSSARFGARS